MLMIPPAFATKSGTQRMPRACRSAASSSDASWLFAAPAIARQRSAGIASWSITPPSALGGRDVRHDEARAAGRECAGQLAPHVAQAHDRDAPIAQLGGAPDVLGG